MKLTLKLRIYAFFVLMMPFAAFGIDLVEGTFRGETDGAKEQDVELFVRPYPGREGSFLGLLIIYKKEPVGFAYMIDQYSDGRYGMVPLQVIGDSHAMLGVSNPTPNLELSIVEKKKKQLIVIQNNTTDNRWGHQVAMTLVFSDKSGISRWVESKSGSYKQKGHEELTSITNQDQNFESVANMKTSELIGSYILREVRPSLHALLKSSMTDTGVELSASIDRVGFFIEKECLFGVGDFFVLMNPASGELTYLKRK